MSAQAPNYDNPETVEKIEEARKTVEEGSADGDALPGQNASQSELNQARETVASEGQPGASHLPGTETQTVTWRGTPLEFDEIPDLAETLTTMYEDDDTTQADLREWANEMLGERCHDDAANAGYWSQFSLTRGDDVEGVIDLVLKLANGMTTEDVSRAEKFRNQS